MATISPPCAEHAVEGLLHFGGRILGHVAASGFHLCHNRRSQLRHSPRLTRGQAQLALALCFPPGATAETSNLPVPWAVYPRRDGLILRPAAPEQPGGGRSGRLSDPLLVAPPKADVPSVRNGWVAALYSTTRAGHLTAAQAREALMSLDRCIDDFLTATRGLFNRYFREAEPVSNCDRAWDRRKLYDEIETALYRALVTIPCGLKDLAYGQEHPQIIVCPNGDFDLPVMLNREIDGGYWDYPLEKLPRDTQLNFISLFDWSETGRMDHRYVRAIVVAAPQRPDIVRKHCLVETQYVTFVLGEREGSGGCAGVSA